MKQRISIALAVVLFASALFATSVALADGHRGVATPHAIALRLEPPYVTAGSTAKIIATFTPGVDVESLLVSIWLTPEVRTDPDSAWINRWREKARKGEAIVVSTAAIFPKPGRYPVGVSYWHADTHGPWVLRANTIGFYILVPGGIETVKPQDELPYRFDRAPKGVQNMPGGEPLFCFPIKTKMNSARDSMVSRHPEKVGKDSIVTAFETLPSAGNTVWAGYISIIATCDKIRAVIINENIINCNWSVVPASLGTVQELQDYRAKFTAGSVGGMGKLCAEAGGFIYVWTVEVIANYQLNGTWLYKGRDGTEDLPWIGSVVRGVDPECWTGLTSGYCDSISSSGPAHRRAERRFPAPNASFLCYSTSSDSPQPFSPIRCPVHRERAIDSRS
jgi:hypothetical protein